MSTSSVRILGFCGSLRAASYNKSLLAAAHELLPAEATLEIFDLSPIPLYNDDVRVQGYPPPVQAFRQRIAAADALVIACPEYNYSIPGVLKNALDWASRPPDPPLNRKPTAIMGATTGNFGTVRAQMHLRQLCVFNDMHVINKPELLVARAPEKFDAEGRLVDAATREVLRSMLAALADFTRVLRGR